MAGSIVQGESISPATKMKQWARKLGASLARPLFAVLLALVVGGIIIMVTSLGSFSERFFSVLTAYQYLYTGSFGSLTGASYSLVKVTSLIFAGLSVAIAFRAGLFNIGAAGQLAVGAVTAGVIGFAFSTLPSGILIPFMIIASALAGAIWGSIVGFLKAWRGAHEVVTTIMLNWIAFFVADYLISGPLQAPKLAEQTLPLAAQATLPSIALFYNQTLGTFLPRIASPEMYTVDVSLIFAFIALVIYWFITSRTTFGYELRVLGQNPQAARYAGIAVKRNTVLVMALAGAFAGLAGALHLMGQAPNQLVGSSFSIDSTGFDAIGVALLGRTTPVGILLSALLFGGLQQAAPTMELYARIPADLISILQALVLFSIAAEFLPALIKILPGKIRLQRQTSLVPNIIGTTTEEDLAGEENEEPEEFIEVSKNSPAKVEVASMDSSNASIGQED